MISPFHSHSGGSNQRREGQTISRPNSRRLMGSRFNSSVERFCLIFSSFLVWKAPTMGRELRLID
ncbi:hypothetical protein BgiMline_005033, partial [Biomphalaria glabrata]